MNKCAKVIFQMILCLIISKSYAAPAYPYKIYVNLETGDSVEIFMRGDESLKYAISSDGYTLLNDSNIWWYATLNDDNKIVKSTFSLTPIGNESDELLKFKSRCPKGLIPEREPSKTGNRSSERKRSKATGPLIGEKRALVILMQYKDLQFKKDTNEFEALFNEIGYNIDGAFGSVRDYYHFASQGQLDYLSDVYGPYTSSHNMRYYGGNGIGGNDAHAVDLCIEAVRSLPKNVDFSIYDNNNDGLIDNVHIIFAGYGEESGANSDAIWSHEYPYRISFQNDIGYSIAGYSCTPELRGNRGTGISHIGVVCHELGHALGAMDYYDTNYGTGGEYVGTGKWDLMASGNWNGEGCLPANFNPYVRSEVFGWNQQIELAPNEEFYMPRMELDNANKTFVYKVGTGCDGDYFLLENRQQYSFDSAIPGSGLLIYHVHPNIERNNLTNSVNVTHPQGLYPVCASYSKPTEKNYGNINSSECPFPGVKNIRSFTSSSVPCAIAWDGSLANVFIKDIMMNSLEGSISFTTTQNDEDDPINPEPTTDTLLVYKESFESSTDNMKIVSITGKSQWRTYRKGNFIVGAENIPEAFDGDNILMLLSEKDNSILKNESEVISQTIKVEPGKRYILSFQICNQMSPLNVNPPSLELFVEDDNGEHRLYALKEEITKWQKVEIPLIFSGDEFKYKFWGLVNIGGVFIDDVRLFKEETIESGMTPILVPEHQKAKMYDINGTYIGLYSKGNNRRETGVYLIHQDGKTKKIVIP